jgi:hypothetical protein
MKMGKDDKMKINNSNNIISFEAMKRWLGIDEATRNELIRNVWCTKCRGETTIHNFSVEMDKFGIVLEGLCVKCNHSVARMIENE